MSLLQEIDRRQATVAVIGLGYVGLPLAVAFAEAGFRVIGIDVNQERVDAVNRGESYVSDVPSEQLTPLVAGTVNGEQPSVNSDQLSVNLQSPIPNLQSPISNPKLLATADYDVLHDVDVAIICVPTPLSKTKDPNMSYIIAATDAIARHLHPDMLIVLESTTYPGTTEELILPRLQSSQLTNDKSLLTVGEDFFLAFSPERIDPGRKDYTIRNTPKVIGGMTSACTAMAQAFYATAIERVVPVASPKVAEMVKLLENTFRAVNIALVNEVAIMCDRLGIDVWEVIEAADTKPFGFMTFYPGPGLGGHCIPIDPQYLAWKLKTINYNARFIQLASEINFGMPQYVLGKIADALNESAKPLKGSQVLVLGVAYKADVGDLRESPALDLIHLLQEKGVDVAYHDPYVPHLDVDGLVMTGVSLDRDALRAADCVVIAADHSSYDWEWVVENSRLVVDTRNATREVRAGEARVVKL
ncbi:MAG: nucleotide sugar dehydrogenase [Anaerolineae bacterium]